jgi:phage terminase large subunit-like protein
MATGEVARFARFARAVGLELEPFQASIMEAVLSPRREVVVSQSRGAGKTTLLGCATTYLLARAPSMMIVCAASARDQAGHLFRAAERFAKRLPVLERSWTFTRREIRTPQGGMLVVMSADSEKQMGHDPSLVLVDELGSMKDPSVYESLRSALIKRPEARIRIISTMGGHEDAPMPTMRRRVMEEGTVERDGAVVRAETQDSLWLEWSVEGDVDDMRAVKAANPASWITEEALAEHRRVLHDVAFRRLHANQHVAGDDAFLAPELWDRCAGEPDFPDGSRVVVAVDAGIRRDSTAVVVVRKDEHGVFHALWRIWTPSLWRIWTPSRTREVRLEDVEEHLLALCQRYKVERVYFDKHLFVASAQRLEELGAPMVEYPQVNAKMVPGTRQLYEVVADGRLRHGGDLEARQHALAAMTGETEMGLRIRKSVSRDRIDALVALLMAIDGADSLPPERRSVYETRGLVGV